LSRASHAAAFVAGVTIASAFASWSAPPRDIARFKTIDAFAQALATVQTSYVDQVDEKQLLYNAARGMLHNLDQYSTFLPPNRYKNLRQDTEGEFGGTGITLSPGTLDETRPGMPPFPTIDVVVPRSPADMAGLQPDDRVVAIEGQATAEAGKELANATAWEARLRGPSGTRITISVLRAGWKDPRPFTIVRAQVKLPTVNQRVIEQRIGYLQITRFSEATSADTAAALGKLAQQNALGALVLDLRADPGGLVDQSIAVADQFLDSGTIVTIKGRAGTVETQTAHKGGLAVGVPVFILVDHGTASASEILSAALRDNGRAKLIGTQTFGKGTVQTFFDLEDGAGLKLTTARYYTPKGNSLESKGLIPDVKVDDFAAEEITAAGGSGSGGTTGSGATIGSGSGGGKDDEDDDDPQLTAAVKLARMSLKTGSK
jgi:carboxyl-terminal processing protease